MTSQTELRRQQAALKAGLITGQQVPTEEGAPAGVRALVGGASNPDDQLATLRNFFPMAVREPVSGRLVFVDPQTGKPTFYNPQGLDLGDVASLGRETAQFVGGTLGAAGGGAAGGGLGAVPGAAAGTAAGEEVFNAGARALGAEDTRTLGERAAETGGIAALGGIGQGVGSAVGAAFRAGTKGAARTSAGGVEEIQQAIDDLARFDAVPSLAQATKSQLLDGLESIISKVPGGAGRFRKVVTDTNQRIATAIERKVEDLTGRAAIDPEFAGKVVSQGIDNPLADGFVQRFQVRARKLYDEIPIDDQAVVPTVNTRETVESLNRFPEAPDVNALITSPTIRQLSGPRATTAEAVRREVAKREGTGTKAGLPAEMTFEQLKRLRSAIGERIGSGEMLPGSTLSDLKALYAGVSRDMEVAAQAASPEALRLFNRANRFYGAGADMVETALERVNTQLATSAATPEQIFTTLERGLKQGPTKIRTVMGALKPEERKILLGGVLRRIGQPTASQGVTDSAEFSFETFLTNWERLDPAAKRALFSRPELRTIREDFDALARAAGRVRESSRAFANPSGSAGAGAGTTAGFLSGGTALAGAITGNASFFALPAIFALSALGANTTARLMTSGPFVKWLAKSTDLSPNGFAAHVGKLAGVAASSNINEAKAIEEYASLFLPASNVPTGTLTNPSN